MSANSEEVMLHTARKAGDWYEQTTEVDDASSFTSSTLSNSDLDSPVPSEPWSCINTLLRFHNTDAQFWWDRTGHMFAKLLQHAGYDAMEQYRELYFYAMFVAPELGLSADSNGNHQGWRSPGTPDYTPIDFSWEFGTGTNATVRYSFEPIGPNAGSELDPLNRNATDNWIARLQAQKMVPSLDLEWYNHFTKNVLLQPCDIRERTAGDFIEETTPKAGTVVALDIEKTGSVMKMYIYPGLKAAELGITNLEVVKRSIRCLPAAQYESLQVEPLLKYLDFGTAKYEFELGILGIDCLKPADARIKIYVRSRHTTIDYLMDAITLGGQLKLDGGDDALTDLHDFWRAFIGEESESGMLPDEAPGRAGPGFYYTIGCGKAVSPKLYVSPQWFCKNDDEVLARLRQYFLSRKGWGQSVDSYEAALKEIFNARTRASRCGSHYYIGCAIHKGRLRVVTYLSPQTFDCEKDMMEEKALQNMDEKMGF